MLDIKELLRIYPFMPNVVLFIMLVLAVGMFIYEILFNKGKDANRTGL